MSIGVQLLNQAEGVVVETPAMTEAMPMVQPTIMWVHLMINGKKKQEETCMMVHRIYGQLLNLHALTCMLALKVSCRLCKCMCYCI